MSEATTTPPDFPAVEVDYSIYWKVWLVLLGITLLMVFITTPAVLIAGMCAKATIIALWFMHLKSERLDFILYVAGSIVIFSAVLFFLIMADGLAM